MSGLDLRELECVLVLGDELHFGRTAERLRISQGRVSQLVSALERRIGARLFERTSRRVAPTRLGERFLAELRPAYDGLSGIVRSAQHSARGVRGVLRLGFSGLLDEPVTDQVNRFVESYPDCEVLITELPLSDPFGAVRRGEVDAAIIFGDINEPDLRVGATFSRHQQSLVISTRHPLAGRESVSLEDLADVTLIDYSGTAPRYWQESVAPSATPSGTAIPRGPSVSTLQEGVTLIAANRGAMIFCLPTANSLRRRDVTGIPITDLPLSARSLIWHQDAETETHRRLAETIANH